MLAVLSAILAFAMGFLASPVAAPVTFFGSSSAHDAPVAACFADRTDSTPVFVSLPATSGLAPQMRRIGRLKATVEECNRDLREADSGPVTLPKPHNAPKSIHFAPRSIPTSCRLRC
jgi:hypothetical protein